MPFNVGPAELVIVLIIAAIIAIPVLLVIWLAGAARSRADQPSSPDPRAVLADRLARGDITRAEFDTAMRALGFTD